jgi:putative transposase
MQHPSSMRCLFIGAVLWENRGRNRRGVSLGKLGSHAIGGEFCSERSRLNRALRPRKGIQQKMARPLRFAPAGIPLHVRSRGNQRQDVFADNADRLRYLELLARHCQEYDVKILGYCLMTNHVHLVLQPSSDDGLSRAMQRLNSEHAQAVQCRLGRSGHLWQGRFKGTPMDENYLWTALRYVELNPVRAGMVSRTHEWPWSSAAAHLGLGHWPVWLDRGIWSERFDHASWRC